MSIALMVEVFRLDLPPTDKLVLLALADAAGDEGLTWIPVKRRGEQLDHHGRKKLDLLMKTSLSERAVQGAIKRLCERQLLTRNEIIGRGVKYMVTPAANAGAQQMRAAGDAGTPAANAGKTLINRKNKETVKKVRARGIEDGWTPHCVDPNSETGKFMATWPQEFRKSEVERFIGYHQARGTVSQNWNRQWATWALGEFCRKALREWNSERANDGQSGNAFVRAAASRAFGGGARAHAVDAP